MSGTEIIAVHGAISSAISIVEASQKVYDATTNIPGLHEAFRKVADSVPLVLDTLRDDQKVQTQAITIYKNSTDAATKRALEESARAAKPLITTCQENAQRLREIFNKVVPGDDTTRTARYLMAVQTANPGSKRKVEDLMKELLETLQVLHTNRFFNDATRVMELNVAIEELSYVSPSLPDEESRYSHFGAGPMNINTGAGTQRNYIQSGGSGTMFNADMQRFSGVGL